MSAGGVVLRSRRRRTCRRRARPPACASGRIGSWSSRRSPGPDAAGKRHNDGLRVGRGGADRLPAGHQDAGQHALRLRVEDRLQREQHVGRREWRAVGPGHAGPQVERVHEAVGARLPLLRQPRLQLERGAVHPHQAALGELGEQLGGLIPGDEAVERPRLGPDGGDNLAATARRRVLQQRANRPIRSAAGTPPRGQAPQHADECRPTREVFTRRFLMLRSIYWPRLKTVQISAHTRAMPNTAAPARASSIGTAKRSGLPQRSLDAQSQVRCRSLSRSRSSNYSALMFQPGCWHCLCHSNGPEAHSSGNRIPRTARCSSVSDEAYQSIRPRSC